MRATRKQVLTTSENLSSFAGVPTAQTGGAEEAERSGAGTRKDYRDGPRERQTWKTGLKASINEAGRSGERPIVLARQSYFEAAPLGAEGRAAAGLGAAGTPGGGAGTPDFALYASTTALVMSLEGAA